MKKLLIKQLRKVLSLLEADGRHRTGKAARACCPAGPLNVAPVFAEIQARVRRAILDNKLTAWGEIDVQLRAQSGGLVEWEFSVAGQREEAPVGNIGGETRA